MPKNKFLAAELKGLTPFTDYTGAATNDARMGRLIDLISQEQTTDQRGHLDQISPAAHRQLIVELNALRAIITA